MKINIPLGSEINKTENNVIKIPVPNTQFWTQFEQKPERMWDIYLIDPESTYKEIIKKDVTMKVVALFSSVTLKTPFPYSG